MSKEYFRISSELKNVIGQDLITDDFVAIFELVKNSFDAQASKVSVIFNLDDKDPSIHIVDDGKGMSIQDIRKKWLFLAYSAKKEGTEDNVAASKAGKKEKAERSGKKAEKKDRKLRMRQNDVKRMDKTTQGLLKKALKARENAYVPFSRFKVGAALLTKEGDVFTGCNIENSSFGLTVCAERTAIFTAASNGVRPGEISVLLVVADTDDVTSPCGACRQVMAEFEIPIVIMANIKGDVRKISLEELLPFGFKAADFS